METTYSPGVQKQIQLFLQYEDGEAMVERYLAVLNNLELEYLGRSPIYCSGRGGARKNH